MALGAGDQSRINEDEKVDANVIATDNVNEKFEDGSTSIVSVDSREADEALELVGIRRTAVFSEEYNLRLRRKLVSILDAVYRRELQY